MFLKKVFVYLLLFCLFLSSLKADEDLLDFINKDKNYSMFSELIKKANYEELFSNDYKFKKVIYIPDNRAFESIPDRLRTLIWKESSNNLAKKIVKTHFFSDNIKSVFKDPKKKVSVIERVELNGETIRIYSNSDLLVKDMVEEGEIKTNEKFTIIPVSCVMFLQPSYEDDRLSDKQKNKSLITSCCLLTDQEIMTITQDYNF